MTSTFSSFHFFQQKIQVPNLAYGTVAPGNFISSGTCWNAVDGTQLTAFDCQIKLASSGILYPPLFAFSSPFPPPSERRGPPKFRRACVGTPSTVPNWRRVIAKSNWLPLVFCALPYPPRRLKHDQGCPEFSLVIVCMWFVWILDRIYLSNCCQHFVCCSSFCFHPLSTPVFFLLLFLSGQHRALKFVRGSTFAQNFTKPDSNR